VVCSVCLLLLLLLVLPLLLLPPTCNATDHAAH
jgi:hypothetical protein